MKQHIVIDARNRRSSTGRYTDRLVTHLQTIDHVNRYTILVQPDDPWKMQAKNFKTVPSPFPQFSLNPLHELRFAQQLYKLKPDLVHFTMTQQPLLYFGRIVTTTHDLTMFRYVRAGKTPRPIFAVKRLGYRFLFFWSHLKSHRIIVPTKFVAADLTNFEWWTKRRIVVTYESSEPESSEPAVPVDDVRQPFILYVGNAFPHKNLEMLIKAFDIVHEQRPSLQLVLVGKQEQYYAALERFAADRSSAEAIVFPGAQAYVTDAQLKWLYHHCTVFALVSKGEGFGLPGLEAMAHGAPVVAAEATCLPELYGPAAHFCNPDSPNDMAEKLLDVLKSEKLRSTLMAAGKKQLKKYSWQRMAEETLLIYQEALTPRTHTHEPDFKE